MVTLTLQGKVALITGASSGIGLGIAQKLASEGCNLILVARNESKLVEISQQLTKEYKVQVTCHSADVTKGEDLLALVSKIEHGSVDFLVNNAGGSHATAPDDQLDAAFMEDINLNLLSTHLSCRLLYPLIKDSGSIVNMSSLNGEAVTSLVPGNRGAKMGYAASKAGVIQLTKLYAIQFAERGVRVNCVAPGPIYPTGMTHDWNEERQTLVAQEIPLRRLGTAQDVANSVYFLLSDLSSFVTGHVLDVNGGKWMD